MSHFNHQEGQEYHQTKVHPIGTPPQGLSEATAAAALVPAAAAERSQQPSSSPRVVFGSPVDNNNNNNGGSVSSFSSEHGGAVDGHVHSVLFQDENEEEEGVLDEPESMARGSRRIRKRAASAAEQETSKSASFTERIEQILQEHAMREEAHESDGPVLLTSSELAELSLLCTQQATMTSSSSSEEGFAGVEGDLLTSLALVLQKHVQEAEALDLFQEAATVFQRNCQSTGPLQKWLLTDAKDRLQVLRSGLEAGNIILQIAVTEGVDRRAVNEDALQALILLFRLHMRSHVVPTLNQTSYLVFQSPEEKQKTDMRSSPPSKKRRRSSSTNYGGLERTLSKELGQLYKLVTSTFQTYYMSMERMELLMKSKLLDDHEVLLVTNAAIQAFEIDCQASKHVQVSPGHQMQLTSIAILSAAFGVYPNHRETILEDIWPILLRLPTSKRSLRVFRVPYTSASSTSLSHLNKNILSKLLEHGGDNHCIQMTTALFLSLIHSCVIRPTYAIVNNEDPDNAPEGPEYASGLVSCRRISALIVSELFKRCKRSKFGSGSDEYRVFLSNLVEDLLSVLIVPEYPASEMILSALLARLRLDIHQANTSSKAAAGAGAENSYLSLTLDVLGKICAVEARLLKIHGDCPIVILTESEDSRDHNDDDIQLSCYCGTQDRDCFILACDSCKRLFHGKCVGLNNDTVPDEWICDSCRLGRIAKREQRVRDSDESLIDRPYIMRHAFLSSLAHRKGVENIEPAVQFHFAQWLDDLQAKASKSKEQTRMERLLEELVNQWDSIEPNGEPLTDEGYNRMILALFAETSPMLLSFRNQLRFVLKIMEDRRSPHLRKLSLKAIEKAADGDDTLMLLPVITRPVSSRLADETISVREAALSFVGHYVISFPLVASAFQPSLILCLSDTGVSVRKRAIRVFQEVLLTNPHYRGRSEACDAMLRRAAYRKEEDTVRDLIYDLFTKLWLQDGEQIVAGPDASPRKDPPPSAHAEPEGGISPLGVSIVTPTKGTAPRSRLKRVELAAEQMMEVVRTSGTGDHLEKLLKQLYDAKMEDDRRRKEKNSVELSRQHLDSLVRASFDLLLSLEENRTRRGESVGKDLAATLRTIEVLSGSAPSATLNHMDTILPYLKADNGVKMEDESMIVSACCDILTRTSSIFDKNDLNRFASTSVAGDLRQIVYKFGPESLNSAIRTLSALAHHPESNGQVGKDLLGLAQTFYAYLLRHKENPDFSSGKVQEKVRCNLLRALAVLGSVCHHRGRSIVSGTSIDEDQFDLPDGELPPSSSLSWSNLTMSCYQVIAEYLKKKDPGTKCAALRALGNIFLSEPRLLFALEQVGLVDDIMSPKAPLPLQLEALECWKRILESEEKRIDAGHAQEKMDRDKTITVTKQIAGDQDGDSNLFGGVLTSHANRLFEMVSSNDVEMRFSSLELLGLLLRQGLVNPNDAVPYLLALQGDVENNHIRSLALEFLIAEGEKRPDMLRQRVRVGVKQACLFQRAVYPQRQHVSALIVTPAGVECVFDKVFRECIAPVRKQREGLYSSLLGLFELKERSQSPTNENATSTRRSLSPTRGRDGSTDLSLLTFVVQILAHLPYTTAVDPLFIIHKIGSIAALQGYHILDTFTSLLQPLRLDNSDEWDDTNEDEDPLEKSAKQKFPSRTKQARPLTNGNFDLKPFVRHCQRSGGFVLLMRLKAYLRQVYRFSEIRCFEFNPNDKEKVSDRGIYKIDKAPRFDSKLPLAEMLNLSKQQIDADAVIRQYALFRRSFRAEMASNAKAEEEKMEKEAQDTNMQDNNDASVPMHESSDVES